MKIHRSLVAVGCLLRICIVLCLLDANRAYAAEWARLSPFTKVRCERDSATVEYQGREYDLISINELRVPEILAVCRREYGNSWSKRFSEDLVEALERAGRPMVNDSVKLVLKDRATGESTTVERAAMTRANRDAVHRSLQLAPADVPAAADLPAALERFEKALKEQWAYYAVNGADFESAIRALREKLRSPQIDANAFALELQKIIALGIDGHAGVSGYRLPAGFLPFLIEPSGKRFVAFSADRSGFLDAAHPFITKLDGKPISDWLAAAAIMVPKGSPQYVQRHSLRTLRNVQSVRKALALPGGEKLAVQLESADGSKVKDLQIEIADRLPIFGTWPAAGSRRLANDIGYLRIAAMDDAAVKEVRAWMPRFRDTKGMVIDVRGNGGGSRDALLQIYSFLAAPAAAPKVVNAAVYRLAPEFKEDHLESRFLFPEASPNWKPQEREAIVSFKKSFRPQWQPPAGKFSDWHFLVLSRLDDPAIFHYERPVAVLMDEKCFSATDIFLAGLKGLPNVRLVGTPSGGGSARAVTVRLTPAVSVNLGSMVSFQSDGMLFDGRGVLPDVVVEPEPEYFIGGKDNVLERAIETLKR